MPLFKPRTTEEILNDAVNYVHFNTNLTDFNVGSVIRTILEALAYEDAEQYAQMLAVLNSFFIKNASGSDLDERAAAYNLVRLPPMASAGTILFLDTELPRSFVVSDIQAADSLIPVNDASALDFTTPFVVRLGEGTGSQEDVSISAVSLANNTLTVNAAAAPPLNALDFDHPAATVEVEEIDNRANLVCLVTGDPSRIVPAGITLRSKPTNTILAVNAITTEVMTHLNGNFASNPIDVVTTDLGASTIIGERRLNQVIGSSPYNGALALNLEVISGGQDAEGDAAFRDRLGLHIAGLSAGTVSAIVSKLLQLSDPVTFQKVQRVSVRESFGEKTVYVYIDDGTVDFVGDVENFPADTLALAAPFGATTLQVVTSADFPEATYAARQYIIVDPSGLDGPPIALQYFANVSNNLNLAPAMPSAVTAGRTVAVAEAVSESTELDKKYYFLEKYPLTEDNLLLYIANSTLQETTRLVENTDYVLNKSNGQIEFLTGFLPAPGMVLLAVYEVFINLIKTVQDAIDGDLNDTLTFPGIRSAGVKVLARPAKKTPIDLVVEISVNSDITDQATAAFLIRQLIVAYINGLDIGESVILAEIIERAMSVAGVTNASIAAPAGDIAILDDHAPFADDIVIT